MGSQRLLLSMAPNFGSMSLQEIDLGIPRNQRPVFELGKITWQHLFRLLSMQRVAAALCYMQFYDSLPDFLLVENEKELSTSRPAQARLHYLI